MRLNARAKTQGVSYRTAWEWFKNGTVPARQQNAILSDFNLVDIRDRQNIIKSHIMPNRQPRMKNTRLRSAVFLAMLKSLS
jgi:hypothetical protein